LFFPDLELVLLNNRGQEPEYLSGIALRYGLDDRGLEYRKGLGIFLFTTMSRPAVGPTQPPVRWVPQALSPGVKRPGREADHSLPSSPEVKNAWSYIHYPNTPSWSGAQLKKYSDNFTLNNQGQ
jgi:hypothetical protein